VGVGGEDVDCGDGAERDGGGDEADASADDGGGVAGEGRRGAGGGGEVEGEDVEEGVGYLGPVVSGGIGQSKESFLRYDHTL